MVSVLLSSAKGTHLLGQVTRGGAMELAVQYGSSRPSWHVSCLSLFIGSAWSFPKLHFKCADNTKARHMLGIWMVIGFSYLQKGCWTVVFQHIYHHHPPHKLPWRPDAPTWLAKLRLPLWDFWESKITLSFMEF